MKTAIITIKTESLMLKTINMNFEKITIRRYDEQDLPRMISIWNEIVEEGIAFPQEEPLDDVKGKEFFAGQSLSLIHI